MSFNELKKEDGTGLVKSTEQDQMDNTVQTEPSPEFDEIGTALNEI